MAKTYQIGDDKNSNPVKVTTTQETPGNSNVFWKKRSFWLTIGALLLVLTVLNSCFGGKEDGKQQTEGEQEASLIEKVAPPQGPTVVKEVVWPISLEPMTVDLEPGEFLRVKAGQIVQNAETPPFDPAKGGYQDGGEWVPGPRQVAANAKDLVPCPSCHWIIPVIQGNKIIGLNVRSEHLNQWGAGEPITFEVVKP